MPSLLLRPCKLCTPFGAFFKIDKFSRKPGSKVMYFYYFTYPLIAVFVAFKEARGLARYIRDSLKKDTRKRPRSGTKYFFKLIFDHILWSLNAFKKFNLPIITLRKTVTIKDTDGSLTIREGR